MTIKLLVVVGSWIVWLGGLALVGCRGGRQEPGYVERAGGDPARGRALVAARSCGACHAIPGIEGAHGVIGPSLAGVARRSEIGGGLPNTPQNLARWVRDPEGLEPSSAMPDLALDEREARDVTAYLYTLRGER
jgi:cytochrome c2